MKTGGGFKEGKIRKGGTDAAISAFSEAYGGFALSRQVAACVTDEAGRIAYANDDFCRLLGYKCTDLLGENIGILKSAASPEQAFAAMSEPLGTGAALHESVRFVREDGSAVWLETTLMPVCTEGCAARRYIFLLDDITAVKEAELSLHDASLALERHVAERDGALLVELMECRGRLGAREGAEQLRLQYESILNSVGEGIYGLDENGVCTFANPAAARMLGWQVDELIGRTLHELIHHTRPDGRPYPDSQCPTRVAMEEGIVSQVDNEVFWRKDGTRFDVAYTTTPLRRGGGNVGAVVVFSDTSERKLAESALRQNHEELLELNVRLREAQDRLLQSENMAAVGNLAAGVAHEINNPIGFVDSNVATLGGYVRDIFTLLEAYEQVEPSLAHAERERIGALREHLDIAYIKADVNSLIHEAGEGIARVKKIVRELREFSHVGEIGWQWADLHQGLESSLNVAANDIKDKAVVVREYGTLPQVECVPSQLNQVFLNLLLNAAQSIDGRGIITLRTGADGGEVWVEVSDTGRGIPPESLSRIFDPFFTTRPVGKGVGLGLSLAYGIVDKHHGRIEVKSAVDKGTAFRVVLPVKQPSGNAA